MHLQELILKFYEFCVGKLRKWVNPFLLVVGYVTAFGLANYGTWYYPSRVHLMSLHIVTGLFLMAGTTIFFYYKLSEKFIKRRDEFRNQRKNSFVTLPSQRQFVNWLFYFVLMLLCLSGILLYFKVYSILPEYLPSLIILSLFHEIVSWFFGSLVLIKFYLNFSSWWKKLKQYLHEY